MRKVHNMHTSGRCWSL